MSKFVPIEVIQETARNQRRARNLAAMHAIASAPPPLTFEEKLAQQELAILRLLAPSWSDETLRTFIRED